MSEHRSTRVSSVSLTIVARCLYFYFFRKVKESTGAMPSRSTAVTSTILYSENPTQEEAYGDLWSCGTLSKGGNQYQDDDWVWLKRHGSPLFIPGTGLFTEPPLKTRGTQTLSSMLHASRNHTESRLNLCQKSFAELSEQDLAWMFEDYKALLEQQRMLNSVAATEAPSSPSSHQRQLSSPAQLGKNIPPDGSSTSCRSSWSQPASDKQVSASLKLNAKFQELQHAIGNWSLRVKVA